MMQFISFTSGSCGNCSLLRTQDGGIMIDAGASPRRVSKTLGSAGMSLSDIGGILITHDHLDHIRSLAGFCKKIHVPVWTTSVLHEALMHHSFTADLPADCRRVLEPEVWNDIGNGFSVRWFEVPHDATQTVGYATRAEGRLFVLMTDLGEVPEEAFALAKEADTVVIESNYDVGMLLGGGYPFELKMRICKGYGHLSNDACAEAVRRIWHDGLRNLFLCHLSGNNNTPRLALSSTEEALRGLGVDPATINFRILPRSAATPLMNL